MSVRAVRLAGALFACLTAFLLLLQAFRSGSLESLDGAVQAHVIAHRDAQLTEVAVNLTALGSSTLLTFGTILVAVLLWTSRRRLAALDAVVASTLTAVLTGQLKALLERPRPPLLDRLAVVTDFSFPSGHTSGITALLTITALHSLENTSSRTQQVVLALLHFLVICGVAWSRVYLGVHYFSDVIAGLFLGVACGLAAHGLLRTPRIVGHLRA